MAIGFPYAILKSASSTLHSDAIAYQSNVQAVGGTVSAATLTAISDLATALQPVKSKIIALYPIAGNSLAAAAVRLYGNSNITWNGYSAGDYAETGASGGVKGNGTSKYGNTNVTSALQSPANATLGFYVADFEYPSASNYAMLGGWCRDSNPAQLSISRYNSEIWALIGDSLVYSPFPDSTTSGSFIVTTLSNNGADVYVNGVDQGNVGFRGNLYWESAYPIYLHARNLDGTPDSFSSARMKTALVAQGLTESEVQLVHSAIAAFNSALNRP